MILSVSRRTDIPNYYSEWFYNRIKEGFLFHLSDEHSSDYEHIKIPLLFYYRTIPNNN